MTKCLVGEFYGIRHDLANATLATEKSFTWRVLLDVGARKEFQFSATNSEIMKAILITSIAVIALTHAAHAKTWAWFHGDIGVASSPVVSSNSPAINVTTQPATKKKTIQKRAVAKSKPQTRPTVASPSADSIASQIHNEKITKL